jgi:hypothetical protein
MPAARVPLACLCRGWRAYRLFRPARLRVIEENLLPLLSGSRPAAVRRRDDC